MSKEKYIDTILRYLADKEGQPVRVRKLARRLGIAEEDYGDFRAAFKKLRDQGRIVLGAKNALTLPVGDSTVVGRFHANPKGFGFISPGDPDRKGDLFVPEEKTMGAMTDDLVKARLVKRGRRNGEMRYVGEVVEIQERGMTRCVGTLQETDGTWFVLPDGAQTEQPVVIRDVPVELRRVDTKVVTEIVQYPVGKGFPEGVIVETLGPSGEPRVEIQAVMRAHGLVQEFSKEAKAEARRLARGFNPKADARREDATHLTVVTVDPESARDYDDAISLSQLENGNLRLGVHIADLAHFVREGSPLDLEAFSRGTSVYFPRHVVPMLPETLSNGVCSLQEGVKRFVKSVYIDYDKRGRVQNLRLAESVICSNKRLTYEAAQQIIDGDDLGLDSAVVSLVRRMASLARVIEGRRRKEGMLHLALPEVTLTLDDAGSVVDAEPADDAYTHTIIEMFMVEANDQVATFFEKRGIPLVRRIHPKPDDTAFEDLSTFVNACGYPLSDHPSSGELQQLIQQVADKPESYAVNLALLRSFQRATYSIEPEPHFALSSPHYCHFTSPIRRYPDLLVHRAVAAYLRGELKDGDSADAHSLAEKAEFLSTRERVAQAAEQELRLVLILGHLKEKRGALFNGVITGVTDFGIFVQSPQFLVEGLIRLPDLGDDWWHVSAEQGKVRGEISGKVYKVGDTLPVRIERVDIPRRHLDLALKETPRKVQTAPSDMRSPTPRRVLKRAKTPKIKRHRLHTYRKKD
jgi:ribonuclease R